MEEVGYSTDNCYFVTTLVSGSFHDRVIRDDFEFMRIARYVVKNPKRY